MSDMTYQQRVFLERVIGRGARGLIAYGHEKRTAKALMHRKLIRLAQHRIVFWNGDKARPYVATNRGRKVKP